MCGVLGRHGISHRDARAHQGRWRSWRCRSPAEKVLVPEQLMEAQAVDTAVTGPAEPDVAVTEAESKAVSTVAGQYVGWLSVSTVAALTTAGTVSAP